MVWREKEPITRRWKRPLNNNNNNNNNNNKKAIDIFPSSTAGAVCAISAGSCKTLQDRAKHFYRARLSAKPPFTVRCFSAAKRPFPFSGSCHSSRAASVPTYHCFFSSPCLLVQGTQMRGINGRHIIAMLFIRLNQEMPVSTGESHGRDISQVLCQ
jgi:hypothetical protein